MEVDGGVLSDGVDVTPARSHHSGDVAMDLGLDDTTRSRARLPTSRVQQVPQKSRFLFRDDVV